VLAGGGGERLGADKAFLEIGGQVLIEGIVQKMARIGDEVVIVTNLPQKYRYLEVRLVSDVYPGKGALGGIYSGLKAACNHHSLVVACDMPFLNPELLRHLIEESTNVDAVVPCLGGQPEPLHALYSKACLAPMKRMLLAGDLKIAPLFQAVRVRYVDEGTIDRIDPRHLSFFNINTQADVEEALRLLREVGARGAALDLGARGADNLPDKTVHLGD